MMTAEQMERFAREWVSNWNSRNVSAVLSHMHDDATFASPLAVAITGGREVRGKQALGAYWNRASAESTTLHFNLLEAICDVPAQTLVVLYEAEKDGRKRSAAEIMRFREGRQISGEALYGAAL